MTAFLLKSKPVPSSKPGVAEQLDANGFVKQAPRFSEQVADSSRTNLFRSARSPQQITEHQGLVELDSYLKNVSETPGLPNYKMAKKADLMRKNLNFIGDKEYNEGAKGLADSWKSFLEADPKNQIAVSTNISNSSSYVKSDKALFEKVLGNFSDEERAKYSGRIVSNPSALTADPQNAKIVMLDDWTISGQQMKSAAAKLMDDPATAKYAGQIEVNLVIASPKHLEGGLTVYTDEGDKRTLPVKSYYRAWESPKSANYAAGAHITGTHSSVDYDFDHTITEWHGLLSDGGQSVDKPTLSGVFREYRDKQLPLVNSIDETSNSIIDSSGPKPPKLSLVGSADAPAVGSGNGLVHSKFVPGQTVKAIGENGVVEDGWVVSHVDDLGNVTIDKPLEAPWNHVYKSHIIGPNLLQNAQEYPVGSQGSWYELPDAARPTSASLGTSSFPETSTPINPGEAGGKGYTIGQKVKVVRSDGIVEGGWRVTGEETNGAYTVAKAENGELLTKTATAEGLDFAQIHPVGVSVSGFSEPNEVSVNLQAAGRTTPVGTTTDASLSDHLGSFRPGLKTVYGQGEPPAVGQSNLNVQLSESSGETLESIKNPAKTSSRAVILGEDTTPSSTDVASAPSSEPALGEPAPKPTTIELGSAPYSPKTTLEPTADEPVLSPTKTTSRATILDPGSGRPVAAAEDDATDKLVRIAEGRAKSGSLIGQGAGPEGEPVTIELAKGTYTPKDVSTDDDVIPKTSSRATDLSHIKGPDAAADDGKIIVPKGYTPKDITNDDDVIPKTSSRATDLSHLKVGAAGGETAGDTAAEIFDTAAKAGKVGATLARFGAAGETLAPALDAAAGPEAMVAVPVAIGLTKNTISTAKKLEKGDIAGAEKTFAGGDYTGATPVGMELNAQEALSNVAKGDYGAAAGNVYRATGVAAAKDITVTTAKSAADTAKLGYNYADGGKLVGDIKKGDVTGVETTLFKDSLKVDPITAGPMLLHATGVTSGIESAAGSVASKAYKGSGAASAVKATKGVADSVYKDTGAASAVKTTKKVVSGAEGAVSGAADSVYKGSGASSAVKAGKGLASSVGGLFGFGGGSSNSNSSVYVPPAKPTVPGLKESQILPSNATTSQLIGWGWKPGKPNAFGEATWTKGGNTLSISASGTGTYINNSGGKAHGEIVTILDPQNLRSAGHAGTSGSSTGQSSIVLKTTSKSKTTTKTSQTDDRFGNHPTGGLATGSKVGPAPPTVQLVPYKTSGPVAHDSAHIYKTETGVAYHGATGVTKTIFMDGAASFVKDGKVIATEPAGTETVLLPAKAHSASAAPVYAAPVYVPPPPPPPLRVTSARPANWDTHTTSDIEATETNQTLTLGGHTYKNVTVIRFTDGKATFQVNGKIIGYGETGTSSGDGQSDDSTGTTVKPKAAGNKTSSDSFDDDRAKQASLIEKSAPAEKTVNLAKVYEGGAQPVSAVRLKSGAILTTTATGAVVETTTAGNSYTVKAAPVTPPPAWNTSGVAPDLGGLGGSDIAEHGSALAVRDSRDGNSIIVQMSDGTYQSINMQTGAVSGAGTWGDGQGGGVAQNGVGADPILYAAAQQTADTTATNYASISNMKSEDMTASQADAAAQTTAAQVAAANTRLADINNKMQDSMASADSTVTTQQQMDAANHYAAISNAKSQDMTASQADAAAQTTAAQVAAANTRQADIANKVNDGATSQADAAAQITAAQVAAENTRLADINNKQQDSMATAPPPPPPTPVTMAPTTPDAVARYMASSPPPAAAAAPPPPPPPPITMAPTTPDAVERYMNANSITLPAATPNDTPSPGLGSFNPADSTTLRMTHGRAMLE